MGLLDNDLSLLGLNILNSNYGKYGRLGPALTGGMTGYLNSKAAMRQQALKEQQAKQARAMQAQQAAMQKAKYQQQLEQYRQKKNAIASLPPSIRPYIQAGAMDAYKATHPTPTKPNAFDQKLNLYRNDPNAYQAMYGKGGMRVSVGPDGQMVFEQGNIPPGREPTKAVKTAGQKKVMGLMDNLNRLSQVADDYKSQYLTYGGKAKGMWSEFNDKLGTSDPEQRKYLAGKTRFDNGVEQFFNAYRKEITGAAASVQELDRLKKSLLNTDMSPAQFEAAMSQFIGLAKSQMQLHDQLLNSGVVPGSREYLDKMDAAYKSMIQGNQSSGAVPQIDQSAIEAEMKRRGLK